MEQDVMKLNSMETYFEDGLAQPDIASRPNDDGELLGPGAGPLPRRHCRHKLHELMPCCLCCDVALGVSFGDECSDKTPKHVVYDELLGENDVKSSLEDGCDCLPAFAYLQTDRQTVILDVRLEGANLFVVDDRYCPLLWDTQKLLLHASNIVKICCESCCTVPEYKTQQWLTLVKSTALGHVATVQ